MLSVKVHLVLYPLTAFFRQTALDPLTRNGMSHYKIYFDIIVADAPITKPAPSSIKPVKK
jgi:hypothetical protein